MIDFDLMEECETLGEMITSLLENCRGAHRESITLGSVNPWNTMGTFMGISCEILENGFFIEYTDMYNQKSVAMFLPSEPHEWDVYDLDRYGYHKVGSMPQVRASNIDIIRLASGGEPNGKVSAL